MRLFSWLLLGLVVDDEAGTVASEIGLWALGLFSQVSAALEVVAR